MADQDFNAVLDRWLVKKQIARGTFSYVSKVVSKDFATDLKCLKVVLKKQISRDELQVLKTSYETLDRVKCRYVVRLRERCETSEGIFMIFDLVHGGTLFDRISRHGSFPENLAAKVIFQVASALDYLHSRNIIYRDLKAEHVLLTERGDDWDCVLSGSDVVIQSDTHINEYAGTPGYVAPEVLKKDPFHVLVDIWALGVIAFIVLGGYPPFDSGADEIKDIHKKSMAGAYEFHPENWDHISAPAKHLITRMLEVDTARRISASEVLIHPFIVEHEKEYGELVGFTDAN